jgi:hypothetical protein
MDGNCTRAVISILVSKYGKIESFRKEAGERIYRIKGSRHETRGRQRAGRPFCFREHYDVILSLIASFGA